MRYLFNPALVLFTILVCSNLSATDPAQPADAIRQQAQINTTDPRPTPMQQAAIAQHSTTETAHMCRLIESSSRLPTEEQRAAFLSVMDYAKNPKATPKTIQIALSSYLSKVSKTDDNGERNLHWEPKELPILIALDYSDESSTETLKNMALREDVSRTVRHQSLYKLRPTDSRSTSVVLTEIGKSLINSTNHDNAHLGAMAYVTAGDYDQAAANSIIARMSQPNGRHLSVIFDSDPKRWQELYSKADSREKETLERFYPDRQFK